jgi:lysyl-tRNA synthetase class 2
MTYRRTASLAALRRRAELLARIRSFFAARGVLEIETPYLSPAAVSDLALESIAARVRSLGGPLYLHTSPEYAMKRLLASGSGDIFQICRVFREDELGRWHQPEFTMLEWYRLGWDELRLMGEVEELMIDVLAHTGAARDSPGVTVASDVGGRASWRAASEVAAPHHARHELVVRSVRVTYDDALERALGVRSDAATDSLVGKLVACGVDVPRGLPHDAVLDLAFATVVAPAFAPDALTFVHDYPASQAALARLKPGQRPVAARFEVFCGGIELANGFHELGDAAEQRRRFDAELDARRRAGRETAPLDEDLLAALAGGLPDCSGVAVGVDRVIALALGAPDISSTMAFAHSPMSSG